jgi:hypothetical protein
MVIQREAGHVTVDPPGPAVWEDLLRGHRAAWVDALAGDLPIRELSAWDDDPPGLVWLDDYPGDGDRQPLDEAVQAVATAGRALVVGLPADAGGRAERDAAALASALDGVVVAQRLAAGSVIVDRPGPAGTVLSEPSDGDDAVHYLVCANVDRDRLGTAAAMLGAAAVPLMTGYVRFLHEANEQLRRANARLARERLGVHDSAAASLAPRISELEKEVAEQRRIAKAHYDMFLQTKASLEAPRYRAVDSVRAVLFGIPGLGAALRLRSRLLQRLHGRRGSAAGGEALDEGGLENEPVPTGSREPGE